LDNRISTLKTMLISRVTVQQLLILERSVKDHKLNLAI